MAGKGGRPSVEDVRDHMREIMNTEGFTIPSSINDEMMVLMNALKG
jgi:hypothetical protein